MWFTGPSFEVSPPCHPGCRAFLPAPRRHQHRGIVMTFAEAMNAEVALHKAGIPVYLASTYVRVCVQLVDARALRGPEAQRPRGPEEAPLRLRGAGRHAIQIFGDVLHTPSTERPTIGLSTSHRHPSRLHKQVFSPHLRAFFCLCVQLLQSRPCAATGMRFTKQNGP